MTKKSNLCGRLQRLVTLGVLAVGLFFLSSAQAAPVDPTYSSTFDDAQTGDNSFIANDGKRYWTIDAGADSYQNDYYERPTTQNYQVRTLPGGEERFAANEYYENLDITQARAGFDSNYLYFSIDLYGRDKSTENGVDTPEGLLYRYGVRLSPSAADGGNGFSFWATQPEPTHGTTWGLQKNTGYFDTNGDVGGTGLSVTKQDLFSESLDNGYETDIIVDGKRLGTGEDVFWSRISPTDNTVVEFAMAAAQ